MNWAGGTENTIIAALLACRHLASAKKNHEKMALDPSLAEAHGALAMACLMGAWDKVEAEREFLRALELNPRYIQARVQYALFYLAWSEGRLEEGVAQAKLALASDPLSAYAACSFGITCCLAGRYAEGLRASARKDSESSSAACSLGHALYFNQRFEEAVAVFEVALAMSGRHPWTLGVLALTLSDWGKPADVEAIYAEPMARARRSYVSPTVLALLAAFAGIPDEAIRHAREALEIRDPMSPFLFSKLYPAGARLLADPRFHEIPVDMGWLSK